MNVLYVDAGLTELLKRMVGTGLNYHLFTNNVTPTLGTVLGGLTEAAWTGYAVQSVLWASFTLNGVANHNGYAIAPPVTFSNSSGASVNAYGFYVTDSGNTILLQAAAFDAPPLAIPNGGVALVTPTVGDFSQFAA